MYSSIVIYPNTLTALGAVVFFIFIGIGIIFIHSIMVLGKNKDAYIVSSYLLIIDILIVSMTYYFTKIPSDIAYRTIEK